MLITLKAMWGIARKCLKFFFKAHQIKKLPSPEREQASYPYAREIVDGLMTPIGARVVYHGVENIPEDRATFFIANHQSALDPFLVYPVMDRASGVVAKKELAKIPFGTLWMKNMGCLFIDRDDVRQSLEVIKETAEKLKMGINMLIFPEGTRSRGGEEHEFKKGSLKPAFMVGAPIVPIYIDGSYKLLEINGKFKFTPAQVDIYFGEAIETEGMSKADQKELAASMKELILKQKDIVK